MYQYQLNAGTGLALPVIEPILTYFILILIRILVLIPILILILIEQSLALTPQRCGRRGGVASYEFQ